MTTKRTLTAVLLALTTLTFTGCGEEDPGAPGSAQGKTRGGNYEAVIADVNGRKVPCIVWQSAQAGAITCDWNAK